MGKHAHRSEQRKYSKDHHDLLGFTAYFLQDVFAREINRPAVTPKDRSPRPTADDRLEQAQRSSGARLRAHPNRE